MGFIGIGILSFLVIVLCGVFWFVVGSSMFTGVNLLMIIGAFLAIMLAFIALFLVSFVDDTKKEEKRDKKNSSWKS